MGSKKQQSRNRRCSRRVTWNGKSYHIYDLADMHNMPPARLAGRLDWGWPIDLALSAPKGTRLKTNRLEGRNQTLAVSLVNKEKKQGKIIPTRHCQVPRCEEQTISAHHYLGYEKNHWRDIVWLCKKHHHAADRHKLDLSFIGG
jgi:hypothetical protein